MSFEPRDYLRHIQVEADYLARCSADVTFETVIEDNATVLDHADGPTADFAVLGNDVVRRMSAVTFDFGAMRLRIAP